MLNNSNKKIKRLLWISGIPAAYTRKLHTELDSCLGNKITYLFFHGANNYDSQRRYETGDFSHNALFFKTSEIKRYLPIIIDYAKDPLAGVLMCGIYPLPLIMINLLIALFPCKKLFWSDMNAFDALSWSGFKRFFYKKILKKIDTLLITGTSNAIIYKWLLGDSLYQQKTLLTFPYPHKPYTTADIKPNPDENKEVIKFLYLGRLEPIKNVISIVEACAVLKESGITNFKLTIAGSGSQEEYLKRRCYELHLDSIIFFTGAVSSSTAYLSYKNHNVFVLASNKEPWGVVVNEAQSAGLAVIGSAWAGACVDCILDGFNGYRLVNNTPPEIARVMYLYIENKELLRQHCCNALSYSLTKNQLTISSNSLISIFEKL